MTLSDVQAKLVAAQNCHPNAVQALIEEALDAIDVVARSESKPAVSAPLGSLELMKAVMAADQAISGQCIRGTTNWAAAIGKAVQDAVVAALNPSARPSAITASVMRDDGGELPAFCMMAAYRTEREAEDALALVTQHTLTRDGILGKEGQVVTAHWPGLPDLSNTPQAESQPAPEYVGNGMFKGETIEKAAENWANWCDVRCMTGLSEFLRVIAARAAAVDERDNFEKVFPLPSGCIRVGAGYASTGYGNWAAHTHRERWEGWNARAIHGPDGSLQVERERICAAIKAEDDHCVDNGDYMLDSDDCIKIVRGEWVRPDFSIDGARKGCKQ